MQSVPGAMPPAPPSQFPGISSLVDTRSGAVPLAGFGTNGPAAAAAAAGLLTARSPVSLDRLPLILADVEEMAALQRDCGDMFNNGSGQL